MVFLHSSSYFLVKSGPFKLPVKISAIRQHKPNTASPTIPSDTKIDIPILSPLLSILKNLKSGTLFAPRKVLLKYHTTKRGTKLNQPTRADTPQASRFLPVCISTPGISPVSRKWILSSAMARTSSCVNPLAGSFFLSSPAPLFCAGGLFFSSSIRLAPLIVQFPHSAVKIALGTAALPVAASRVRPSGVHRRHRPFAPPTPAVVPVGF